MTTKQYDNEKVIFGRGVATTKYTDPDRDFMLFFLKELGELIKIGSGRKFRVLDVGCGAGAKTKALKLKYPDLYFSGCDISKRAIFEAGKDSLGVNFVVADAAKLPYNSNEFDVVIMNSVLDHTDNPKKSLGEVYRVLKNNGTFLITSPLEAEMTTIHGWLTRYFESFRDHRKTRCGHNFAFSKKSLTELLTKAGFQLEKIEYSWFYLSQIIDIFYYLILEFIGKSPEFTIKNCVKRSDGFINRLLGKIRTLVVVSQNIESLFAQKVRLGWFVYIKTGK